MDAGNLTISTIQPDGNRLTFSYDALRRWDTLVDAAGGWSTSTYDAAGRLKVLSDPDGDLTSYSYDAAGRRTGIQLANLSPFFRQAKTKKEAREFPKKVEEMCNIDRGRTYDEDGKPFSPPFYPVEGGLFPFLSPMNDCSSTCKTLWNAF